MDSVSTVLRSSTTEYAGLYAQVTRGGPTFNERLAALYAVSRTGGARPVVIEHVERLLWSEVEEAYGRLQGALARKAGREPLPAGVDGYAISGRGADKTTNRRLEAVQ